MICLKCRDSLNFKKTKNKKKIIVCSNCGYHYLLINNIPLMFTEESDFYNYRKKFLRFDS